MLFTVIPGPGLLQSSSEPILCFLWPNAVEKRLDVLGITTCVAAAKAVENCQNHASLAMAGRSDRSQPRACTAQI